MNLVLRLYDERNIDRIDQYFTSPIHLQELSTGQDETVKSIKEFDVKWTKAFEQKKLVINDIVAGKDHVCVFWTWYGIHNQGEWKGVAITNKVVIVPGISLYTIADNKISSIVQSSDSLQLLESLR